MEKQQHLISSLASALALAVPAPASAEEQTTNVTLSKSKGNPTVLNLPNAQGDTTRVDISTKGGLTIGLEKFSDSLTSSQNYLRDYSGSYNGPYLNASINAGMSAQINADYQVTGNRITVDQKFKVADIGPVRFDGNIGGDIGKVDGQVSANGLLNAHADAKATITLPPAIIQQYGQTLNDAGIGTGPFHFQDSVRFSKTKAEQERRSSMYGGVNLGLTSTLPITEQTTASANISGRYGAESRTSQKCAGVITTFENAASKLDISNGLCAPIKFKGRFDGYYLSAAFQERTVHDDKLFNLAEKHADRWANTLNTRARTKINESGYKGSVPNLISQNDILKAFGIDNPYLKPRQAMVIQAGTNLGKNTSAHATVSAPLNGGKPSVGAAINYSFD